MTEPLSAEELDGLDAVVRAALPDGHSLAMPPALLLRLIAMAWRVPVVCPDCRGSGGYVCEPCDTCHGSGTIWKEGA